MTVIEQIVQACETAVLNQKPIIVIRTNEIEIIRRVVESDRLVTRLSKKSSGGVDNFITLMTCSLDSKEPTRIFAIRAGSKDNNVSDPEQNFNIRYLSNDKLRNFSGQNKYGLPEEPKSYDFPHMYIIQYRADSNDIYSMWRNIDLNPFIENFLIDSLSGSAIAGTIILLYGEDAVVPPAYQEYCEIIDEPYPDVDEIKEYILNSQLMNDQDDIVIDLIADNLTGLPLLQVERILKGLSLTPLKGEERGFVINDEIQAKEAIRKYKEQILKKDDLLELIKIDNDHPEGIAKSSSIGGMLKFKEWIDSQKVSIKHSDALKRDMGAIPAKGVLLCGIPGCGKSMAVESVATTLGVPLIKLDISRLMGKYVGESEHNMIKALKIAEAMSPCVLFIDELDKGFSGAKSTSDDSGPFKRMFGTLLGWMQNCKKPCFIFATANDISSLPKEFFRSGRFDCMYSLFMPTLDECVDIFSVQMKKAQKIAGRAYEGKSRILFEKDCFKKDNLKGLVNSFAEKEKFVTGADIAKLVNMSLRALWNPDGENKSINFNEWRDKVNKSLDNTSVYGEGKENIDSIAICYVRLMRNNFLPASDLTLFNDYKVKEKQDDSNNGNEFEIEISKNCKIKDDDDYDKALQNKLKPLIEKYGAIIEKESLEGMLR